MNRAHATGIPAKAAERQHLDEFLDRRQVTAAATAIVPAARKRAGEGGDAALAVRRCRDGEITPPAVEETSK